MGNELTDKERIAELEAQLPEGMKGCTIVFKQCDKGHGTLTATNWVQHECATCKIEELADAFNRVCSENADFVAESIKDETRIAELEGQLRHCEGHAAELEAGNRALWRDAERLDWLEQLRLDPETVHALIVDWKWDDRRHPTGLRAAIDCANAALHPERRKGERRKYTRITADRRQAK
jgi:hypothetical protein